MKLNTKYLSSLLLITLLFGSYATYSSGNEEQTDKLLTLRNNVAKNYSSPDQHLELAKHHYLSGNKILGFYISEDTRAMFGDEKFDESFEDHGAVKLKELKEFESEKEYNEYIKSHPSSPEAKWNSYFESLSINKDGKITSQNADDIVERAIKDLPDYLATKSFAAKYFLKEKKDYETSLELYIDLYFDNPHYYDWEFAEFRIKTISAENKNTWWEAKKKTGESIIDLIKNEKNPRILGLAINEIRNEWRPEYTKIMISLFRNDDPNIQRKALHTILSHLEDAPNQETIEELLTDQDLTVRAMASFLVVKCLGENHFNLLKGNLESGVELIQYDTMQALVAMGGLKGKEFLKNNPPQNAHPELRNMWQQAIQQN